MADNPNPLASMPPDPTRPAVYGVAVVPSDSTDLTLYARALWIGGAGTVTVNFIEGGGVSTLISGVASGTLLPFAVSRVYATGTTATLIVALR